MAPDWDKRYREGFYGEKTEPHDLVRKFAPLIPRGRPVVDIAMGRGRDLMFLARSGFPAYGLERSREAINLATEAAEKDGTAIGAVLADALSLPFRTGSAGAVLVFYFLERKILSALADLLGSGGLLLYQTFLKRQNDIDRPRNPEYLLDDGELLDRFRGLELLFYEEGVFCEGGKQRALARFVGRKK